MVRRHPYPMTMAACSGHWPNFGGATGEIFGLYGRNGPRMAGGHRQNVQFETAPAMERPSDFRHARPADRATMKNSQNVLGSFLRAVFLLTSLMIATIIIGEVYLSVVNIDGLAGRQSRILNTYQAKQEIQQLLVAADDMLLATRHYLLLADENL